MQADQGNTVPHEACSSNPPVKRKRGRPRKNPTPTPEANNGPILCRRGIRTSTRRPTVLLVLRRGQCFPLWSRQSSIEDGWALGFGTLVRGIFLLLLCLLPLLKKKKITKSLMCHYYMRELKLVLARYWNLTQFVSNMLFKNLLFKRV